MKKYLFLSFVVWIINAKLSHSIEQKQLDNKKPPNIIFILADDLGFNNVGYHNSRIITPHIDELAKTGVTLEQNYMQPLCTPSRSSLMTGMYPYHIGRQQWVIYPTTPTGLTLNRTLLPEALKNFGYDTHLVGKWHLGHCNEAYLPMSRGFDTHFGYWEGSEAYWTKVRDYKIDFKDGFKNLPKEEYPELYNTYSTYLYTERASTILDDYAVGNNAKPFFMYLATQSIHDPLEVPIEYEEMYPDSNDSQLRKMHGMITALDDVVGNVTQKLKDVGIYENTIIVFSSDNGGIFGFGGNKPLKGFKSTIYEGGTRVPGFIHSPLLYKSGYVSDAMVHVTDWFPTILRLAGAPEADVKELDIDGIDQYETFFAYDATGDESARKTMIYNIKNDTTYGSIIGAIRDGDWKYIREAESMTTYNEILYDLKLDYTETTDVSEENIDVTMYMRGLFDEMASSMVSGVDPEPIDSHDDVDENGYIRSGWCEI